MLATLGLLAPGLALADNALDWTSTATATSLTQRFTLSAVPGTTGLAPTTRWIFGGGFTNGEPANDAWWVALTTGGPNDQGTQFPTEAFFTLFQGIADTPGPSATCDSETAAPSDISCSAPIPVVAGDVYDYSISEVATGVYSASITNETAGVKVVLAKITARVPSLSAMNDIYDLIDNIGGLDCSQQSPAAAWFATPVATGGTGPITSVSDSNTNAPCAAGFGQFDNNGALTGAGLSINTSYTPPEPSWAVPPAPAPPAPAPPAPAPPTPAPPNPAPTPPATPVQSRVSILTRRAKAVDDRRVRIRLACKSSGAACKGQLKLTTQGRSRAHQHATRQQRRAAPSIRIGGAHFSLRAGKRKLISVTLTRRAQRLLRSGRALHARTSCSGPDTGDPSRPLTLVGAPQAAHKRSRS